MHGHESELLTTTFLMLSAVSFGLILRWLKQPPLVGYILAGLALGPAGLELVDYSDEISSLAEFGVILLLFIIGIELSVKAVLDAILPLQSLLLVVFFVSIGLLVDLDYVKSHWGLSLQLRSACCLSRRFLGGRFYHWAANQLVARWYHHW